jgi:hypothetical protein
MNNAKATHGDPIATLSGLGHGRAWKGRAGDGASASITVQNRCAAVVFCGVPVLDSCSAAKCANSTDPGP